MRCKKMLFPLRCCLNLKICAGEIYFSITVSDQSNCSEKTFFSAMLFWGLTQNPFISIPGAKFPQVRGNMRVTYEVCNRDETNIARQSKLRKGFYFCNNLKNYKAHNLFEVATQIWLTPAIFCFCVYNNIIYRYFFAVFFPWYLTKSVAVVCATTMLSQTRNTHTEINLPQTFDNLTKNLRRCAPVTVTNMLHQMMRDATLSSANRAMVPHISAYLECLHY